MSLGDFWLQSNNGKKYSLKDLKDIKPEDIAKNPKLQKFIKLFDLDGSGTIEIKNKDGQNEWKSIFTELQEAAVDNDLSKEEFGNYISKKLPDEDIQLEDVNELLDIASSTDTDEIAEKQIGNKTITSVNGKVTQVITDLGNGQIETTLYEYVEATENSAAHVVLTTIKGKDYISLTKVIAVDENGEYDDNQFIYRNVRTIEDGDPVLITIGKNKNGQILEQKNKADKTIVNIYNESSIKQFDKTDSERLYQQIQYSEEEQYSVVYDGQGNTYLPIKNGEGINNFLARVNKELRKIGKPELTIADLKRLNPKIDLNNLKVANPHTGDTGMLLISGTHDADSSIVISSGTVAGNAQAQANDAMRKAADRVNNKNFKNHTLTKTYTSFEALAKELGVDVLELMTLNQSETSANGLMALTKGATVRVPVELTGSDTPEMIRRAFPLNAQNRIFYQRYNSLDETQKRNVLNVVRSMQGKSAKEIKDAILNYYPDINLFDSGLTVPIKRAMQGYQAGQSNIVSLETFITDYLKLDLRSEKGQTVYKRLLAAVQSNPLATMQNSSFGLQTKPATTDEEKYIQAVQTNLNQLAASEFPDCSKMEVHEILELLFNAGIPRTRQENEIHQSRLERNPMYQQKKRQEFAADVLYNMMKQASDILHDYYSKIGYLSGDAVWQGLKNIANYATFGNVETIWKEMDKLDDMVARAEKLKHAPNHVEFEKLFKEFTNGFAFDNDKMQNLIDITIKVQKGEVTADSDEYINAFKGAFGSNVNLDIVTDTQKSVSGQQTKGSICDIVMMLTALGNIGKLAKAKQFAQWAISALGKYGGSALVGAVNLGGWTAVQKGTNLLTREADVTSEDLKDYGWEIVQSAGFGAAGGVWGNLAVSRVMGWTDKVVDKGLQKYLPKVVEKHMAKVATKVGDLFKTTSSAATTTAKSGVDVMAIAAKTPGYVAQGTGFLTEVAGFTGYQTIVDTAVSMIQQGGVGIESIQNILIQKAQMKGELTDEKLVEIKNMSYTEAMLNLLVEEGGEQLQSLGTIKGVEAAMKFIMSGRIGMVPDAASFENCKTLKGMEIKPTSVDGKEFYEITMPDGKKVVANNEHDLVAFCNQQMQIDVLTNMVTEKLKKEGVEVSGVALVKAMGADKATVRTAKEGQRTSNLQVKPIQVDGQIKYEITDVNGNVRTVDKVIDVINTTQSALSIDKIESVVSKQLKNGQSVSAKSLLKLVMSKEAETISINGVEVKPNEVLENNSVLENWKISKTDVDGNEVYTLTMENGRTINVNSLENVIKLCENRFRFAILEKIALENPESIDLPDGKLNDVVEASATNPAANAEARVREEWTTQDLNTRTPELDEPAIILKDGKFVINEELAGRQLEESVPTATDEVTTLIFRGKLGETLKTQYENAGKVFEEVITKNADNIAKLEKKYANNREQLAVEFTRLLAQELGVKGIEPKIKLVDPKDAGAAGYFNWTTGELLINQELTNPKDIETIIAHEFVHVMQFKDIVAAKGQDAVREIYLKNNGGKYVEEQTRKLLEGNGINYDLLSPQEQAEYRDATADILAEQTLELNAGLVKYAESHPLQKGSLNEYLTRIYQAENQNMAIFDTPEYYSQLIENEAYFLGNGKLGGKIKEGTKLPTTRKNNNPARTNLTDDSLKLPAGALDNTSSATDINQQLLNETVDVLKQLGASDKQLEEFKANCDEEVLKFVQERLNSPDFSPFADNYLKSLNKYNLSLIKKLLSDSNFDVLSLGLVANAAYTPYLAKQIEGAFDNGKDIIPGCQRIAQQRAKVEAEAQDPAVIARKQAYENAQKRIMENTALSKRDVDDLRDWADIREESIQDLIIYCEKNGIKGYQNILYKCFENREGKRYPTEVIKEKVELALRGLENKLDKSELTWLLSEYDKNDIDTVNKMFDTAIEERRIELQKQAEKELAINNRKNELREKYNNSTISNAIEGILSSEKLPEELLFKIDELLGDTPTEATCKFLLDCIEKIDSKKFNLSEFTNNFNSELKLPNLAECKITESWKVEAENCAQRQISSDYLATLTNSKGEPLFNGKMVTAIEELAKTNPKAANLIVDKCIKNPDFARPFIIVHLCDAVKTDANLAFTILNMKNNNGSARFDELKLGGLLSAITENSDLIRETIRLEQLGNVRLRYNTHKMDIRSNDPYKFVNYEIDDLRNEFAIEVGKFLETKRTVDGREMYHSYWDIQECLYDAIKTNPDVALYYLNKNSSSDYRAVFDGRVVKALASMTPRLEKYFRERFESITNDDGYIQTDRIKDEIGPINERNAQLAEKLYLDLNMHPDEVKIIIQNAEYYPIDFFTEETCKILLRIKNDGADLSKTLFALFDESIPQKLPDKIKTLLTLQMLTPEDVQIFKKHGIDVNKKIEIFQNAIDKKHPIIETKPENARAILKALANNGNADEVLQNMDFSMFEQNGIRLQYTREEFMQKMAELIAKYQSSFDESLENVEIPTLKLTAEQEAKTQDKINQLRSEKEIKTYTFVINGKECTVERFLKSKPNGSNEGDFALIDGKLYYIKFPSSDRLGQSVEEVIASQLYRAAGVDAPNETYLIDKNGVVRGMASEYVPEMQNLRDKSMLFDSFAVDAWLANWDAPKNDNTQMYGDGNVIKSDVGGALHYRAKGELKVDFGNVVNELVSLIENNPLYANMSKADLIKSLEHVINVPNEAIIKAVKESPNSDNNLLFTLLKRKEFIQIFTEKVKMLDETKFNNITSLIKEAKRLATKDFEDTPDVAGMLGYTPTKDGFEGLLNTQDLSGKDLTPEQRAIADEMVAEIKRFTVDNRLADDVEVSQETRDFINGILQGVPEFAAYFGKPQHGNGNVDADGRQISGHQYPLDIHILKVLQSSVNDPWYSKTDSTGDRILDDESRIVLKFSALLHDIGKKYLTGRDAGHASLSAEYVYSILDRFNLPTRTKNRIINMVNNHHWLEAYCKGQISDETVATMFRTTEDFTIARIMARADLENVREGFFTKTMMADFPNDVHNAVEANQKFEQIMDHIQSKVDIIEKNQPMIMPSKFVEVPERVTSDGRVIARRGFPIVQKMLDGKMETFKVLNLHDLDPETDMYQYGFGHIKLKDLRLLVHRAGDGNRTNFNTFKLLGANPQNTSLQSLTLIKATDPGTYVGMNWSFIMEGNMSNLGVADYKNAGTGRLKTLEFLVDEFFGNGKKDFKPDDPRRTFFRNNFVDYFKNKGIEVDDKTYAIILKYVRNKQYVETQIKDLKIGDKIFKKEDLIEGLIFARDMIIEKNGYTEHNEETMMDCVPVAGGIAAESFDHVEDDFLRICRDNCDGKMIIW